MTSAPTANGSGRHYFGPDLLRFFASILVVLFHISEMGGAKPSWPATVGEAPLSWLQPVAWMGWIGVPLFFVLSGFLISASAVGSTSAGFLWKRAIRVFPALWIACVVSLAARAFWGEPLAELLPAFFRTIVLSPKGPYIDGIVWTLVVEAVFYVVVAWTIALTIRWIGIQRGLVQLALIIGIGSSAFSLANWLLSGPATSAGETGRLSSFAFDLLLLRQGTFFAIGMLLHHLLDNRLKPWHLGILALFSLGGALQIDLTVGDRGNTLVPVAVWATGTILMFASVKFAERMPWRGRMRFTRQLGLMTYPLYLNHFVLGQAILPLFAKTLPASLLLPSLLSTLLAFAWFIAWGPERWLQRAARSWKTGTSLPFRRAAQQQVSSITQR